MVQLKQVSLRLKSIKNIQKITKTMKMVSASKFTKAERELQAARPFGYAPRKFYESSHLVKPEKKNAKGAPEPAAPAPESPKPEDKEAEKTAKRLYVAITSDRVFGNSGANVMCGGAGHNTGAWSVRRPLPKTLRPCVLHTPYHSGVARRIRREFGARGATDLPTHRIVCVGDKSRALLRRTFAKNILISFKEIGRIAPTFADASAIASLIAESKFIYDTGEIYYNKYFTPVKYEMTIVPFFNKFKIEAAPNMHTFDEIEQDQLEMYSEFTLAALLYYVLKESAASEQSARMAAMDNATKNASEMIKKLTLLFNRTRQAVITRELIEIISGAAALK